MTRCVPALRGITNVYVRTQKKLHHQRGSPFLEKAPRGHCCLYTSLGKAKHQQNTKYTHTGAIHMYVRNSRENTSTFLCISCEFLAFPCLVSLSLCMLDHRIQPPLTMRVVRAGRARSPPPAPPVDRRRSLLVSPPLHKRRRHVIHVSRHKPDRSIASPCPPFSRHPALA